MKFNDLAVRGIDISGYNGAIDWAKVKASSHFVIIRAGYGNTTDKTFLANWKNASVPKAAYWYMDYYSNWYNKESKAYGLSDVAFGLLQANYCWELLKGDPGGSIVWLDIESGGADYSPNITSSPAAGHAQAIAKAFLMEMDRLNGRKNGIYCSVGLLTWFDKWFRDRPLWVAWYTKTQTVDSVLKAVKARGWDGDTLMWQYASDGDIDEDGKGDGKQLGSSYNWLDLNVWIGDDADWLNWKNGGVMDIKPLAQGDARWGGDKLGTSNTTISGYGCLITCVTMMLNHLGWAETPGTLNVKLRDNGGYHNGNLFVWGSLSALYPGVKFAYRYSGSATDKINASLAAGMPVIVHVDYNPSTPAIDEHWVLVVGRQGDDYIINDPKDGKQLLFSTRYGVASKNIHTVCTYNFSGIVPPAPPEPPVDEVLFTGTVTATPHLNLRDGPGTKYEDLGDLATGTQVNVYAVLPNWYRVDGGYVASAYVKRNWGGGIIEVPLMSQKDPRWRYKKLGTSASTIGSYGCTLTSVAMVCAHYGKNTNPDLLNQAMIRANGYENQNLWRWWVLPAIYPDILLNEFINCESTPAPLTLIDTRLASGIPVIVKVDYYPGGAVQQHWILLCGKQGDDYIAADPISGTRILFREKYGDPARYIFRVVTYVRRGL